MINGEIVRGDRAAAMRANLQGRYQGPAANTGLRQRQFGPQGAAMPQAEEDDDAEEDGQQQVESWFKSTIKDRRVRAWSSFHAKHPCVKLIAARITRCMRVFRAVSSETSCMVNYSLGIRCFLADLGHSLAVLFGTFLKIH